jgi:hypothetical protein
MSDLLSPETRERRRNMLRTAMGPAIALALDEPDVVEVLVNPDGRLWLDRHGSGRADTGVVLTPEEAERIIRLVASHVRAEASGSFPIVSAELPETGERFEGLLPPVALAACFAIRKPATTTFYLSDYVNAQIASPAMAAILGQAVAQGRNILVAGGTGSGKFESTAVRPSATPWPRVVIGGQCCRNVLCARANGFAFKDSTDRLRDLVGTVGEHCQPGSGGFRRACIDRLVGKKRDDDNRAPRGERT